MTSLAILSIASWSRYTRSSMLDVLHQDYVRTAFAKGLHERRVIFVHVLKNILIPVITVVGFLMIDKSSVSGPPASGLSTAARFWSKRPESGGGLR